MKQKIISILKELIKQELGDSIELHTEHIYSNYTSMLDSIMYIKLIVELETAFDIEFDDDKLNLESFSDLDEIVDYIKIKVEQK